MSGCARRTRGARAATGLATALLLHACALERPVSPVPTEYDFGPPPAYVRAKPIIPGVVLVASVRAPAWLDDDALVYRLLYEDPEKPQPYALSRWAAAPASLIAERLRSRLAALTPGVVTPAFAARSDYTLRIELEDFSQRFAAPGDSRVLVRARATLLSTDRRALLAQRVFDAERAAEPNAPGAVKALTAATDAFLDELVAWIAANVNEDKARAASRVEREP